ncbi:MAG: CBS domain-containing protein [Xenococcaceae cyanobacterium]
MQPNNFFPLEQIIDRQPLTVNSKTPLREVIRQMQEWANSCYLSESHDASDANSTIQINNSCALVVEDARLEGIFTERDLVRLIATGEDLAGIAVGEVMSRELITLTPSGTEDVFIALNLLRKHSIRHLPIVDESDRLLGLITEKNLRQNLKPLNLMKWLRVEEVMSPRVIHAPPTILVRQAAKLMADSQVSYVAIVESDREPNELLMPVGIITERDIVQFQALNLDFSQPVQRFMSTPLFLVNPEDSLWSIHEQMQQRRVRRLLVAGSRGELRGIITQTNLLQLFDPTEMYEVIEVLQRQVCQLELERAEYLENRTSELEEQLRERISQVTKANQQLQQQIEERQQIQTKLAQQLELEQQISSISARFLNVSAEQISTEIESALQIISESNEFETGYIFRFGEDQATFSMTHEWVTPEATPQIQNAQTLPVAMFPWAIAKIKQGETLYINSVAELPSEAAVDRENWHIFNLCSLVIIPLKQRNTIAGWIGFASFSQETMWSSSKINLLQIVGEIIASTLQRQQTDLDLQASEQRFNSILTSLKDVVWLADAQSFQILYLNSAAESIYGHKVTEFYENPQLWLEVVHAEDRERVNYFARRLLEEGKQEMEYRIVRPDGEIRWLLDRVQVIYNEDNIPVRLDGIITDISERKQAEAKIQEQAALIDITTDAIIVRGLDNQILFWNRGAEQLYGWKQEEALERDANELLDRESLTELNKIQQIVREKGEWQGELNQVTKAVKDLVVESRWTLVKDEAGNPQSYLVVNTDITEQKQLQNQFLRAQRLESLGTLAGGIAHDLNNILAPILGFAKLLPLKLPNVDEQTKEYFKIIETNAQRGSALVRQILTFARGLEGDRGTVQIRHLIAEIKQIIEETFPKVIELTISGPKNLWTVNGDINQLHQVLMNLAVNARDAMPNGGQLTIKGENFTVDAAYAQLHLDAQPGSYVLITVADTGVGLPAEIIDRIFEPFFTTKEPGRGTGLGLSTVIGIVKSHGGFVDVVSEKKRGTQFKVFLPASNTAAIALEATEELPPGNGELILVVDDEPSILDVTKATLETYNYRVLTARNGIDAIALYTQNQAEISVVLMDLIMPEMSGLTAMRTLRKINPSVKLIANSGLAERDKITAAERIGIKAFLSKPYTAENLLQQLKEVATVD